MKMLEAVCLYAYLIHKFHRRTSLSGLVSKLCVTKNTVFKERVFYKISSQNMTRLAWAFRTFAKFTSFKKIFFQEVKRFPNRCSVVPLIWQSRRISVAERGRKFQRFGKRLFMFHKKFKFIFGFQNNVFVVTSYHCYLLLLDCLAFRHKTSYNL